jgi:5-methylcytosine-specific restriction endonuclease McrA
VPYKDKEKQREYCKLWARANRGRGSERKYRDEHKEEIKLRVHLYYLEHKEKFDTINMNWREEHPERIRELQRESANRRNRTPEGRLRVVARNATRWAIGIVSKDTIVELQEEYAGICPYCNKPITDGGSLDHIVPISKGGTNDRDNLVWCCRRCNFSKNNTSLLRWMLNKALKYDRAKARES